MDAPPAAPPVDPRDPLFELRRTHALLALGARRDPAARAMREALRRLRPEPDPDDPTGAGRV